MRKQRARKTIDKRQTRGVAKGRMPSGLDASIQEDALIQGLVEAKGRQVEVIAFGIAYTGALATVDLMAGFVTVVDGDDQAMLEFERIESFRVLE